MEAGSLHTQAAAAAAAAGTAARSRAAPRASCCDMYLASRAGSLNCSNSPCTERERDYTTAV